MFGARAVLPEGLQVAPGAVTFILCKTIMGIQPVKFAHVSVPLDLGQDGRGGD